MISSNQNLFSANELALSISADHEIRLGESSTSWFITTDEQKVAIWANNSSKHNGCITSEFAAELNIFLDQATPSADRVILFLDSAGVELHEGWQAMKHTAQLIKRLFNLYIKEKVTTISVLGEGIGCFGGAFLLAASCQYTIGKKHGRSGVSGAKVISQLASQDPLNRLYYQATYRLINRELFCILPEPLEEKRNLLMMLDYQPLSIEGLKEEFLSLQADALEDRSVLSLSNNAQKSQAEMGFRDHQTVGCDEILNFCETLLGFLESKQQLPIIMGNCDQEFSFLNEQRGFSRYLAFCMKLLRYLSEQGQRVRVKVDQQGSGATFIALSMMSDTLLIEKGSQIYPLPLKAMQLFVDSELPTGNEWQNNLLLQPEQSRAGHSL